MNFPKFSLNYHVITLFTLLLLSSVLFVLLDNPTFTLDDEEIIKNMELDEVLIFSNEDRLFIGTSQHDIILNHEEQSRRAGNTDIILFRYSKDYELIWSRYFGGSDRELISSAILDNEDNIFLAGQTWSEDLPGTNNSISGSNDMFFSEIAPNGTLVRTTTFGGNGTYYSTHADVEQVLDIAIRQSGQVVLIGDFHSTSFMGNDFSTQLNWTRPKNNYILEFDRNGTLLEETYFAATWSDDPKKVVLHEDDVFLTGCADPRFFSQYNGKAQSDYRYDLEESLEIKDIMLIQKSEDDISVKFIGGSGHDCATDIEILDGSIFLTGTSRSSDLPVINGEDLTYNGGWSDIFLMKLDLDLSLQWGTYLGGALLDGSNRQISGSMISIDDASNIYLSSISYSENLENQRNNGQFDVVNAKYSSEGSLQWLKFFGGENNEILNDWVITNDTLLGVGFTDTFPIKGAEQLNSFNSGYRRGFIFELTYQGEIGRSYYV